METHQGHDVLCPDHQEYPDQDELNHSVLEGFSIGILIREVGDIGRLRIEVQHVNLIDQESHRQAEPDDIPAVFSSNPDDDRKHDDGTGRFAFPNDGCDCEYGGNSCEHDQLAHAARIDIPGVEDAMDQKADDIRLVDGGADHIGTEAEHQHMPGNIGIVPFHDADGRQLHDGRHEDDAGSGHGHDLGLNAVNPVRCPKEQNDDER